MEAKHEVVRLDLVEQLRENQLLGEPFCLVLLSHELPSWWETALRRAKRVVVADGGAEHFLRNAALRPDALVVGDFDSITAETKRQLETSKFDVRFDECQDTTDCEKALRLLEQEKDTVLVLGGLGGRMDHTLYNVALAARCSARGQRVLLANAENAVCVIGAGATAVQCGKHVNSVGLFPVHGPVRAKTSGLQWDVDGELSVLGLVSVSNRPLSGHFTAESSGPLAVIATGDWK